MSILAPIIRLNLLESVRRQVHLLTLFLGGILLIFPGFVNAFNLGRPEKIVKDIGLTVIGYYITALAIFLGSVAIPGEIERKTIHPLLARPVSRFAYVAARFYSVLIQLVLSLLLLGFALLAASWAFLQVTDWRLWIPILEYLLQASVLAAACVFFSTFASPILGAVLGIFTYMVGGLPGPFIKFFLIDEQTHQMMPAGYIATAFKGILPHFEFFQVKDAVVFGDPVSSSFVLATIGYAVVWAVMFLVLGGLAFERRDL
ncbi:MAG: ABC transporter permease subunit [Candidatus Xenobia bacterium]